MGTPAIVEEPVSETIQNTVEIVDQVSEYGDLITHSLYLIIGGMLAIFILHILFSKFVLPFLSKAPLLSRLLKVIMGTFYVLILAIAILIVLRELGFEVNVIAKISLLAILSGAVLVFFLVPFLPKLPFVFGNMVEINGVMGVVDRISSFHTTIRKFDGTLVYVPNALVMATKILNYHQLPERRIEMTIQVSITSDIDAAIETFLQLMREDERVTDKPAEPVVFAVDADSSGLKMTGYCWVKNADWLSARSDLWIKAVKTFMQNDQISMARPQNDVYLFDQK